MTTRFFHIAAALLLCGSAEAESRVEFLYGGEAIVTGQGEGSRAGGLASALQQVLVKVSGDPRLTTSPAASDLSARAGDFVASFDYRDRMAGIPVHDEQGTRDRPYDLIVEFDPPKIDAALQKLGSSPWNANRPEILALVGVRIGATEYVLTSNEERGRDQREALSAEAERFGVPVILPTSEGLERTGVDISSLDSATPTDIVGMAKTMGGDAVLIGTLTWSEAALGWVSEWRLSSGMIHRWRKEGGSFDQAFRTAVTGTAQILSGNGRPD